MTEHRAIVVGGGIAGLAAAASLTMAGWTTTVLEQSDELGEVGAGLAVTPNGMAALDAVGAGARVRECGWPVRMAGTRSHRGDWLLRLPPKGSAFHGVHRADLHAAVREAARDAEVVTGARVTAADPGDPAGPPARVSWDGAEREAELVVGADGVRSAVRSALFGPDGLRYGGHTSWRAVIDDDTLVDDRFVSVWGPDAEFGALRIGPRRVYWYGYIGAPAGHRFDDELAACRDQFAGWPREVRDVVAATTPAQLMRHDVWCVDPLPTYVRGRVALVGDAAHAMLPTMGQGANSSLEDGVSVGPLIRPGADLAAGLAAFDAARRPRTQRMARRSEATARIGAHLPGGWRQSVRNTMLRLLPAAVLARIGTDVLDWRPPPPREARG